MKKSSILKVAMAALVVSIIPTLVFPWSAFAWNPPKDSNMNVTTTGPQRDFSDPNIKKLIYDLAYNEFKSSNYMLCLNSGFTQSTAALGTVVGGPNGYVVGTVVGKAITSVVTEVAARKYAKTMSSRP